MNVENGTKMILIRYNIYKNNDFISEHKLILSAQEHVWILKTGKEIPETKLHAYVGDGGYLVLRSPKSQGGNYYLAHVVDSYNGEPKRDMKYPDYYHEMIDDEKLWMIDSLAGTWFKVNKIERINDSTVSKLRLISNGKNVDEVIRTTRSTTMYITCDSTFDSQEL